jgi:predicted aconitase with swiveling domain
MKIIEARGISNGIGTGEAIVMKEPFGFYGNVDPKTGIIIEKGNPLEGKSIKDKVLFFPYGKGSTVGSYVIYGLKKNNVAPAAIINTETETIVASGAILAGIPCVDKPKLDIINDIKNGDKLEVDGTKGTIKIL